MITMPKELKEKWVAALRSGEYQQCTEALHNGTGYCCLGVLQMVADGRTETGALPSYEWLDSHNVFNHARIDDGGGPRFGFWVVTEDGLEISLATLNDEGESFNTIAYIIEEKVVGV